MRYEALIFAWVEMPPLAVRLTSTCRAIAQPSGAIDPLASWDARTKMNLWLKFGKDAIDLSNLTDGPTALMRGLITHYEDLTQNAGSFISSSGM